jgi:putative Mn2+ efflux pump MntP
VHAWLVWVILPAFGLDTLAVSAGLGLAGSGGSLRLSVTFGLFEGLMPALGALVGRGLGGWLAGLGGWVAALLLAALGLRQLWEGWRELGEKPMAPTLPMGLGGLALAGLSVSLDELGAGLGAGLVRLPLLPLLTALALQAAVFTWLGLRLGARLRDRLGRYGELAAGLALLGAAGVIALSRGAG